MRKLTKTFCCIFVFLICITIFTACSYNSPPTTGGLLDFYKNDGYYEISASPYLKIKCNQNNTVKISQTTLYKENSVITLSINEELLKNNGFVSCYVNLQTDVLLSGFKINNDFVSVDDIVNYSFKIKKDSTISAVFDDIEILGCAIYTISDQNENKDKFLSDAKYLSDNISFNSNTISTKDNFLLFATEKLSNTATNTILSNVSNTNTFDKHYYFEIPLETTYVYSYLILKCKDDLLLIHADSKAVDDNCFTESNISINNPNGLNNIIITTTNDLSSSNEYKK